MPEDEGPWDEVTERREIPTAVARDRLSEARDELAFVRRAAEQLAVAVEETAVRGTELRKLLVQIGVLLAVLFVLLFISSTWQGDKVERRMDKGFTEFRCILLLPDEERTAGAIAECLQGG